MAVLVMTNAQWQQQQQAESHARQQEDMHMREQRRMQEQQAARVKEIYEEEIAIAERRSAEDPGDAAAAAAVGRARMRRCASRAWPACARPLASRGEPHYIRFTGRDGTPSSGPSSSIAGQRRPSGSDGRRT